ncbi:MAG: DUF4124 domain-containing protein [Desulfobacter sp.]|nr:MAG: DUF4124 domain-containing protein [Desulfobacter sp.]
MKTKILSAAVILFMILSATLNAEFYKYTDGQGNTLFTDDLSKIPQAQREKLIRYKTITSPAQPRSNPEKKQTDPRKIDKASDADLTALKNWILDEQIALDNQKIELEAMKPGINTLEDQNAYNEKGLL